MDAIDVSSLFTFFGGSPTNVLQKIYKNIMNLFIFDHNNKKSCAPASRNGVVFSLILTVFTLSSLRG